MKRKKQDFHRHKIKALELEETQDFESLKEKTLVSLDHLGEQRFSEDPAGYSFENWIKSFNLLLDDFEEKTGQTRLPKDYFDTRADVTTRLITFKDSATVDIDSNSEKLKEEEAKLRKTLLNFKAREKSNKEIEEREEKIASLEEEKEKYLEHLEKAKQSVSQKKKQIEDSKSFIRRIFAQKPANDAPLETLEERVANYESKLDGLERKISEQRKRIELLGGRKTGDIEGYKDEASVGERLNVIASELESLSARKLEASQLLEKRKEVTSEIKKMISSLQISDEANKS